MQHVTAPASPNKAGLSRQPSSASAAPRRTVALFFYTTLLAPAAPVNKLVFVVLVAWLAFDMIVSRRIMRLQMLAPFTVLAIFAYGLCISFLTRSDEAIAVQYFTSALVLFLFYFVHRHRVPLDGLVERCSLLLVAAMVLFWLSIAWPDMPLGSVTYDFFDSYNFSSAVDRDFFDGNSIFTLQLGTTPFLFVGLCVVWLRYWSPARRKTDLAFALLILAAILASGLRGLVVVSAVFVVVVAFARVSWPIRFALLALLCVAALGVYLSLAESQVFSLGEPSNAAKLGHFRSFLDDLTPGSFLFGRGLGNYYFSSGSGKYQAYTELSPIDMMRFVGVPLTLVLYFCLLFPIKWVSAYASRTFVYAVALFLYVVLSMTNPVMFNSYGMLVVVWYWSKLHWHKEDGL